MNDWRPMDEAPKDIPIQAWVGDKLLWVEWNDAWGREGWFVLNRGCEIVEPTRWLARVPRS